MKRSILAIVLLAFAGAASAWNVNKGGSLEGDVSLAGASIHSVAIASSNTSISAGPDSNVLTVNGSLAVTGGVGGAGAHVKSIEFCNVQYNGANDALTGGLTGALPVTGGYVDIDGNATVTSENGAYAGTELRAGALAGNFSLSGEYHEEGGLGFGGI